MQRNLAQYFHLEHILATVRLILIFLLSAIREMAIEEKSSMFILYVQKGLGADIFFGYLAV